MDVSSEPRRSRECASRSRTATALPLAWEVVPDKGNVELEGCKTMLEHVAKLVGRMRRVTFLADRGFRSREWAHLSRIGLGLHHWDHQQYDHHLPWRRAAPSRSAGREEGR